MTDEITQNDCQGEDEFMAYYGKLSFLEAQVFKAIGLAFQLKDFGQDRIDNDGAFFEQTADQVKLFTASNKEAAALVMGIVNPELERLKAELREARERLATATTFTLQHRGTYVGEPEDTITVEWRADGKWAVLISGASVLNTDGEWEHEPSPSSRTDEFRERTRFSLDEAFARARAFLTKGEKNDG